MFDDMFASNISALCPSCRHEFSFVMSGGFTPSRRVFPPGSFDFTSRAFPPGSCIVCPSCGHTFSMTNAEIGAGYYKNQFYHAALIAVVIIAALSLLLAYAL